MSLFSFGKNCQTVFQRWLCTHLTRILSRFPMVAYYQSTLCGQVFLMVVYYQSTLCGQLFFMVVYYQCTLCGQVSVSVFTDY